MKTFIGIPIISEQLSEIQSYLREEGYSANPGLHLTLKFLGYISEKQVEAVHERLQEVKFSCFSIQLTWINTFPGNRRVLWVSANNNSAIGLHKIIDETLRDIFPKDKRFTQHITIARATKNFPTAVVRKCQARFVPEKHDINKYNLYESVPGKIHHVYKVIHRYILQ